MANFSFDIALGREVELHNRVNDSDPTNAAFILLVLALTGLEDDEVLRTYALVSTMLAASNNEVTNANYARKILTDVDIAVPTVNTTLHKVTVLLPNQTFTAIGVGDTWAKAVLAYDNDSTGGTDANHIPVCAWDLRDSTGNYLIPATTTYILGAPSGYLSAYNN